MRPLDVLIGRDDDQRPKTTQGGACALLAIKATIPRPAPCLKELRAPPQACGRAIPRARRATVDAALAAQYAHRHASEAARPRLTPRATADLVTAALCVALLHDQITHAPSAQRAGRAS